MKIHVPKDMSSPPVPPAGYRGSVTGFRVKTSQEGNPYILWEVTLLSQAPNAEINTVGRRVFDQTTLTESSLWRLGQLLDAVDESMEEGEYTPDEIVAIVTPKVLNKELFIVVTVEPYQGSNRNKIAEFRKLT